MPPGSSRHDGDMTMEMWMGRQAHVGEFEKSPDVTMDSEGNTTTGLPLGRPEWSPTTHEELIMATLSVISFMVSLDACIIVTSLSAIVADLGGSATQGFWVGTSYLLVNAMTMPLIASLSDIFGRTSCLVASLVFFSVGTLLCCLAQGMAVLLAGRGIQGVGGGGIVVLSLVIFTDIIPLRFRPRWYGTVQGAWAVGNCIGPVIGGVIVEHTTWRWVFYLMFPFCGFGLVAVPLLLNNLKLRGGSTTWQRLGRLDWTGAALFIASASAFFIAILWSGSQYAWSSAGAIVPLCLGAVGLVVTVLWERFGAGQPFLRHSLFAKWTSVAAYVCSMLQGLLLYGSLYYVPLYFLSVKGFGPTDTGIAMFPTLFTLVPSSIAAGALITRIGRYRWAIWAGWALTALSAGLTLLWDVDHTPTARWASTLVALGLGHGAVLTAQNFATQACCSVGDEGAAAAMYAFMRQLGMALGVGIGGSAFQNILAQALRQKGLPEEIARDAEAFVSSTLVRLPDASDYKHELLEAYAFGLRGVYAVFLGVAVVALVVSLAIRHVGMDKAIISEHRLGGGRAEKMFGGRGGDRGMGSGSGLDVGGGEEVEMMGGRKGSPANSLA